LGRGVTSGRKTPVVRRERLLLSMIIWRKDKEV